ncbi:Pleckstrin y domain-containing H member 2 [Balamuthia mandrillaris]
MQPPLPPLPPLPSYASSSAPVPLFPSVPSGTTSASSTPNWRPLPPPPPSSTSSSFHHVNASSSSSFSEKPLPPLPPLPPFPPPSSSASPIAPAVDINGGIAFEEGRRQARALAPLLLSPVYLWRMERGFTSQVLERHPCSLVLTTTHEGEGLCLMEASSSPPLSSSSSMGRAGFKLVLPHDEPSCLSVNDTDYVLRSNDQQFFLLRLEFGTPKETQDNIDTLMMFFSIFYKKIFTDKERAKMEARMRPSSSSTKVATKLEDTGAAAGRGFVKGASHLGHGLYAGSNFVKKHSTSNTNGKEHGGGAELDPELQRTVDSSTSTAESFRKGMVTVSNGIFGGLNKAGKGIAKGGHWSHQKYKETNYYKEHHQEPEQYAQTPSRMDASMEVGKGGVNGFLNAFSGLSIGAKMTAGDIRDTTTDVVQHKYGEAHSDATYKGFNVLGNSAVGGYEAVRVATLYYSLAPKIAFNVGVGGMSYDPYQQDVLRGRAWRQGWMKLEGGAMEPWKQRWAVLRSYSLAWYRSPSEMDNPKVSPVAYVTLNKVRNVAVAAFSETKHHHSFRLECRDAIQQVCLEPDEGDADDARRSSLPKSKEDLRSQVDEWINAILCLASVQQHYLH